VPSHDAWQEVNDEVKIPLRGLREAEVEEW
jgi:hypothetical protein